MLGFSEQGCNVAIFKLGGRWCVSGCLLGRFDLSLERSWLAISEPDLGVSVILKIDDEALKRDRELACLLKERCDGIVCR